MYIPICQDELIKAKVTTSTGDTITLLSRPLTGANEHKYYSLFESLSKEQVDDKSSTDQLFDLLCAGYILDNGKNEEVLFKETNKPPHMYFSLEIKSWLTCNAGMLNTLSDNEKKN